MRHNELDTRVFAVAGLTTTELRRLRTAYCSIGEALPVQPRTFTDNRNPASPHKAFLGNVTQLLRAIQDAPTPAAKDDVAMRACAYLDEAKAIITARVTPVVLAFPDVRRIAQAKDCGEDEAQEAYSIEPTPANAERWAEAIECSHRADQPVLSKLRALFTGRSARFA